MLMVISRVYIRLLLVLINGMITAETLTFHMPRCQSVTLLERLMGRWQLYTVVNIAYSSHQRKRLTC